MGSLKDALKDWKARGTAAAESRARAEKLADAASKMPVKGRNSTLDTKQQVSPARKTEAVPQRPPKKIDFATSGVHPIGRPEHFTIPKEWVGAGTQVQAPGGGAGRGLTVRVGIDFGTAYTKVAISAAQTAFFVDWAGVTLSPQSLFLPGVISVFHGGATYLGRSERVAGYLSDLKLPFLPGQETHQQGKVAATIYLAWVMRYARAWFFHNQPALCEGRTIAWEVNIGCPTIAWDDKVKTDLYEYIGHAAWRLSLEDEINMKSSERIFEGLERPFHSSGLDALAIVPEFVAQIAGYVRSPQRRPGLHFLVDCGAGTVDAVTFNVHKNDFEETDRYPIWAAAVEPLGGHFLMARRANAVGAGLWDDSEDIPTRAELADAFPDKMDLLDGADRSFGDQVSSIAQQVIDHTRAKRTPLALAWDYGLPLFITGGAASCSVYPGAINRANTRSRSGFLPISLPKPRGAEGISDAMFHRLSVAYGLTFDRDSLGHVVPPKDLVDFSISGPPQARERPDRDELYPK